jgi:hypothetical protein
MSRGAGHPVLAALLPMVVASMVVVDASSRQQGTMDSGASVTLRRPTPPSDPSLAPILQKVAGYVTTYLADFSNLVIEEDYVQFIDEVATVFGRVRPTRSTRHLVSDLLLVRVQGPDGWVPFRDVFTVDGKAVRDRSDRLRRLFLDTPGQAMREAWRITEESARYNIGTVHRTLNLPTLPLVFLMPEHVAGFTFRRRAEETIDGARALRLDYEEKGRPTVVRRSGSNEDMPARGSLWIDAQTGRIQRTRLETTDGVFRMSATVRYRPDEGLGLWVPAEMEEAYIQPDETIRGTATYRNFRRFQVTTDEQIRVPKD